MVNSCTGCAAWCTAVLFYCCDVTKYTGTNRRDLLRLFITWPTPNLPAIFTGNVHNSPNGSEEGRICALFYRSVLWDIKHSHM
jgi:hypothetical protein